MRTVCVLRRVQRRDSVRRGNGDGWMGVAETSAMAIMLRMSISTVPIHVKAEFRKLRSKVIICCVGSKKNRESIYV
jgi:hypothetical protein